MYTAVSATEMEMGQWVMGHSQWHIDPWWNNCAVACNFKYTTYSNTLQRTLFLVDIKKLLTHSTRPIIIAGGLILIYDFLLSRPRGLSSTTMPRPLLVPCVGWSNVIGHGSWVTKDDPFPSLIWHGVWLGVWSLHEMADRLYLTDTLCECNSLLFVRELQITDHPLEILQTAPPQCHACDCGSFRLYERAVDFTQAPTAFVASTIDIRLDGPGDLRAGLSRIDPRIESEFKISNTQVRPKGAFLSLNAFMLDLSLYHNCDSTTIQLRQKMTCSFFACVELEAGARDTS